jgi:hypothetical protein
MVAQLPMFDEVADVNFRFSCRVYNMAWIILPSPIYFYIETKAWEESLEDDPDNPAMVFPFLFEEILFARFGDFYDAIVQEIL